MCDIIVSLPDATSNTRTVFGKNSDRPAGECQVLYDSAGEDRPATGGIRCAFVEIPDVPKPLRTLGCRPYWCWGYETGMNEAGVIGGNTAVYTRSFWLTDNQSELGLTGMELLRLGLERGRTAEEAALAIAELLRQYGQWAPAVLNRKPPEGCYENAFLLADAAEAWIVETTGRRWVASRYTEGTVALSNQLTIRESWSRGSDDLADFARQQGWWQPESGPFDFALAYSDHEHYARQVSNIRWRRSRQLLAEAEGRIDASVMMGILRDHYDGTFLRGPQFNPFLPDFLTLCMHDSPAGFTWGNTATSVIVEVDPDAPASSPILCCYQPPCTSAYVAGGMESGFPAVMTTPGTAGLRSESPLDVPADEFRPESMWWRMYRLLGAVAQSPAGRAGQVRSLFDDIEDKYLPRAGALSGKDPARRAAALKKITEEQVLEVETVLNQLEKEWQL
jgi:secernin